MKRSICFAMLSVLASAQLGYANSRYPIEVAQRPFLLPSGMWKLTGTVGTGNIQFKDSSMSMSAGYGVSDDLEVSITYDGMTFNQFNADPLVKLGGSINIFANDFFVAAGQVSLPVHFEGQVVKSVGVSFPSAFVITPDIAVLPFTSGFLDFEFENGFTTKAQLPIMLGWQVEKHVWIDISTNLASTDFTSAGTNYVWETTPVYFDAVVAVNSSLDFFATAGFDNIQKPGDTFSLYAGVTVRGELLAG